MKEFCKCLFLPPRCPHCNAVLGFVSECETCRTELPNLRCGSAPIVRRDVRFLKEVHAVYDYRKPIRGAVERLKFNDEPQLADVFGDEMAELAQQCGLRADLIVPVPMRRRKLRERGYSAPLLLAQRVGQKLGIQVVQVLEKIVETPDQHGLTRQERKANLLGAFEVMDKSVVRGKRILLIDDVFTTGATLEECAKMLLAADADRCDALCFAQTPEKSVSKTK